MALSASTRSATMSADGVLWHLFARENRQGPKGGRIVKIRARVVALLPAVRALRRHRERVVGAPRGTAVGAAPERDGLGDDAHRGRLYRTTQSDRAHEIRQAHRVPTWPQVQRGSIGMTIAVESISTPPSMPHTIARTTRASTRIIRHDPCCVPHRVHFCVRVLGEAQETTPLIALTASTHQKS